MVCRSRREAWRGKCELGMVLERRGLWEMCFEGADSWEMCFVLEEGLCEKLR